MTSDDLNAPLGQDKRKRLPKLPAAAPQILAGVLGLFGIAVVAWAIFVNDPLGGEPTAVVATGPLAKMPVKPAASSDGRQYSRHDGPSSDKALTMAEDLLRGTQVNSAFPPNAKAPVPN